MGSGGAKGSHYLSKGTLNTSGKLAGGDGGGDTKSLTQVLADATDGADRELANTTERLEGEGDKRNTHRTAGRCMSSHLTLFTNRKGMPLRLSSTD